MLLRTMRNSTRFRTGLLAALAPLLPLGCADSVTATDASADTGIDLGAPVDRVTPPDTGTPVDSGTPIDVIAAEDRPDAVDAPAVDVAPQCPTGRGKRQCMTRAQVEDRIRNPPGLRPPEDAGAGDAGLPPLDVPSEPNGCYSPRYVQSGCCNPAYAVEREGDQCCYLWCDMACCGRPMVVRGEARAATMVEASAWSVASEGEVAGLDAPTRAALARRWRDDGRMEHASVASFARFTLELMALGAPPSLLAEAQQAALDEVAHARSCLALASRLDGSSEGPGPLDVGGALDGICAEKSLRDAIVEGCVGETIAALVAQAQLRGATEPEAVSALTRIAADEERHAHLAWRFVAWALREHPSLRGVAGRCFADALSRAPAALVEEAGVDARAWRAWGRLGAEEHAAAVREALSEVIAPCAKALMLGEPVGRSSAGRSLSEVT
ncbi:MAG: ferritin-like domain-containing protein [Myxococcaceae bacterium]|nr:MAG: ferritin-like domain-containing protein [Myxococcaceae bacterium]